MEKIFRQAKSDSHTNNYLRLKWSFLDSFFFSFRVVCIYALPCVM